LTFDRDRVAVIIVGFRNARDVRECIAALSYSTRQDFDIFICENGGGPAFQNLSESLAHDNLVVAENSLPDFMLHLSSGTAKEFVNLTSYRLREKPISLFIAEVAENLGYAGAINIWLRLFLTQPRYSGFWILNPDTLAEPDALSEMVKYAKSSGKGMVGSRIVPSRNPSIIHSRGLRWRPIAASTEAVDYHVCASQEPDIERVERLLDAPSGASFYVTRECVEKIGLMDERYFLFFEDLDWGMRAKKRCGLGYAYRSVVRHHGGTTIGSAGTRSEKSNLTVFLEFRNRLLFVRHRYPAWFPWTVFVLVLRALEYLAVGSLENTKTAYRGIAAGLTGQSGRPDQLIDRHTNTQPGAEIT
jgi:N-acetylglucosaminyl-diphospho-decaprenol L-rhamnosyltransferase